ncbi:hypothetical protein LXL04_005885 [Taraxacum kok-saghyz]
MWISLLERALEFGKSARCGHILISYPFGIGSNCSFNDWYLESNRVGNPESRWNIVWEEIQVRFHSFVIYCNRCNRFLCDQQSIELITRAKSNASSSQLQVKKEEFAGLRKTEQNGDWNKAIGSNLFGMLGSDFFLIQIRSLYKVMVGKIRGASWSEVEGAGEEEVNSCCLVGEEEEVDSLNGTNE